MTTCESPEQGARLYNCPISGVLLFHGLLERKSSSPWLFHDAKNNDTSKSTSKKETKQEEKQEILTTYERNLVSKVRNCCKWGVIAAKKGYHCHVKSINADRLFNMITTKKIKLESRASINRHMREIKEMSKCKEFHKTFAKCCRREIISQKKRGVRS